MFFVVELSNLNI